MMLRQSLHRTLIKARHVAAALVCACAVASCNGFIYEDEGDCAPKFRVKFRYDKNLKRADAFANEVNAVNRYVIDSQGRVVHRHTESGERLKADGYEIVLDGKVAPGNYRLLAWCGDGAVDGNHSFRVEGSERLEELSCRLIGDHALAGRPVGGETTPGGFHSTRDLQRLYHHLTDPVVFPDEEGYHYYTLPLVKDTNAVRIVLQNLSGTPIDDKMFDFTITTSNGRMNYDNELLPHEPVVYHAWDIGGGSAVITGQYGSPGVYSALIADLTMGRLVEGEDVRLDITRKDTGKNVFSAPLIDLALMFKRSYYGDLTNQQYLDYQDEYNFTFFLDENKDWAVTDIYIEDWHVVLNNPDI